MFETIIRFWQDTIKKSSKLMPQVNLRIVQKQISSAHSELLLLSKDKDEF
ncbi:hypothetical protein WN55_00206 [Dufourea novaeangliae]|uniref:Uncharacterized protein n=1 Tax=Dufourea novaeangliae TaxID=178035 RepID=A0A154PDR9_DUFNO|nr:hypothetical protein WN55_00206 [Dufourea novaeangliae]